MYEINEQLSIILPRKKCHTVPKAGPCVECYNAGLPAVTCRMKLKHLGCSVKIRESTINTGKYEEKSGVAQTCKEYGLPECCTQLVSLTIRHMHPSMQPATKKRAREPSHTRLRNRLFDRL